jgi:fumarate reductase flavoprotein subunit
MMPPRVVAGAPPQDAPHVSVAIVGAGACGLVAAITLRDAGIDCVLLERDAQPSGSTALSSGFIPAPGTAVQKSAGINDSPEQFAHDIQAKAHNTAAPHLVKAYSEAIGPAIDALCAQHAIEFIVLDGFLYPGHSVRRMHAVPEKTGAALVAQLERAAVAAGADILCDAQVTGLWADDQQRITGVCYTRPDGSVEHLRCDALLLACNGFGGNAAMVAELLPEMKDALFAGHTGNDGSAIAWGRALGARTADLQGYQGHGSWATPQGALITWALMMEGGVQLNARGERFHDETQGYSEAAVHVLAQPGGVAWNVFDGEILKLARTFPDFGEAEAAGAVKACSDLIELAALIGCNTINTGAARAYNHWATALFDNSNEAFPASEGGQDARAFKRQLSAPFYAIKVTGALFHTQGGLDIDAQCRVLRQDGAPMPNLLAAGGAARGVSGNAVWGYLSGNGLLSTVAGGAIAAKTIAALLKEKP